MRKLDRDNTFTTAARTILQPWSANEAKTQCREAVDSATKLLSVRDEYQSADYLLPYTNSAKTAARDTILEYQVEPLGKPAMIENS